MDKTIRKVTDFAEQHTLLKESASMLLKDLRDFLLAFNAHNVEYLVVGAYAVGVHAEPRATKDLDVLIRLSKESGEAVFAALADFGAPLSGLTPADFSEDPSSAFQVGTPPSRIGILKQIEAIDFDVAWSERLDGLIDGDVPAHVLSRDDLIRNKLAVGRGQDLVDVEKIRAAGKVNGTEATPSIPG